jgi:SAM-dependent methyltransferase
MTAYCVFANGRLAYFRKAADAQHWDAVWKTQDTERLYAEALKGELGYYEGIFPRHFSKSGKILEAGCGLGQFVIALRQRGYDAEGVDYAPETIRFLNQRFPDQPFRVADVTAMDVPDGSYAGYISLGVMEHLQEGPQAFLQETYRILVPGGIACISVPYLNFLRRLKARLGLYRRQGAELPFYQYAYSAKEFSQLRAQHGFEVVARYQYGGYKGIKDELPWLSKVFEWPQGWRLRKWLMNSKWVNAHHGHMMMYVARKPA